MASAIAASNGMKGKKYAQIGKKRGKPAYRTPSRIRVHKKR